MTTTNVRAWLALEGIATDHVDDETLIGLLREAFAAIVPKRSGDGGKP